MQSMPRVLRFVASEQELWTAMVERSAIKRSGQWHYVSDPASRRLLSVWFVSTAARATILIPSLLAAWLVANYESTLPVVAISFALFSSGLFQLILENDLIGQGERRNALRQSRLASVTSPVGVASIAIAFPVWVLGGGSPALGLVYCVSTAISSVSSEARTVRLARGELLRPYLSPAARNLSLSAFLAIPVFLDFSSFAFQVLMAAAFVVASLTELRTVAIRLMPPTVGPPFNWKSSWHPVSGLLVLGLGVNSIQGVVIRIIIGALLGPIFLANFEYTDRVSYLAFSGIIGGIGPEIQRISGGMSKHALMTIGTLSVLFLALLGAILGLTVPKLFAGLGASELGFGAVVVGVLGGVGAATTITSRLRMGLAPLSHQSLWVMVAGTILALSLSVACGMLYSSLAFALLPLVLYQLSLNTCFLAEILRRR